MPAFRSIVFGLILTFVIIAASSSTFAVTLRLTSTYESGNLNGQTIYAPINLDQGLTGVVEPTTPPPSGTYQWTFTGPYQVNGSSNSRAVLVKWTTRGTYTASIVYTASTGTLTATVNVVVTDVQDQVELTPSHPCSQESQFPSVISAIPTWINFTNYTQQGLKYYWLNYSGQRQYPVTFPANMPGYAIYQPMWAGLNWVVTDENDVCLGIYTGIQQTGRASIINVASVQFEKISPNVEDLSDNPTVLGGGRKIFPDRKNPGDANEHRVRVKATLSHYLPNQKIYFRNFDVDDPSTDPIVDSNGNAGDDNRGKVGMSRAGQLSSPQAPGTPCTPDSTTGLLGCPTDTNGVAKIDFTVTMNPGDNFAIAASLDPAYLMNLTVNGTDLKDANMVVLPVPPDSMTAASLARGARSQMLTVWRKLHLEVDSMGIVTGNKASGTITNAVVMPNSVVLTVNTTLDPHRFEPGSIDITGMARLPVTQNSDNSVTVFTTNGGTPLNYIGKTFDLYDDDDFDNEDFVKNGDAGDDVRELKPVFSRMQTSDDQALNIFAAAYLMPIYDGGGSLSNNSSSVPFLLNVPSGQASTQLNRGISSAANENDDFWVIYFQIGYQQDTATDRDPDNDYNLIDPGSTLGITPVTTVADSIPNDCSQMPRGGNGSLSFQETIRDHFNHFYNSGDDGATAPHEIGHQLGLLGDGAKEQKIMSSDLTAEKAFIPNHIHILRCRVQSPSL